MPKQRLQALSDQYSDTDHNCVNDGLQGSHVGAPSGKILPVSISTS